MGPKGKNARTIEILPLLITNKYMLRVHGDDMGHTLIHITILAVAPKTVLPFLLLYLLPLYITYIYKLQSYK